MKGVIINTFENFLNDTFGVETWDNVLDEAKCEDVFVGTKTYDDKVFFKLFMTSIEMKGLVADEALKLFGRYALPVLMKYGGDLVSHYENSIDVLLELDSIIHVEVKKLMDEARPPKFIIEKIDDKKLHIHYISDRNLPSFVEGLLEGLAYYYNEKVDIKSQKQEDGTYIFNADYSE